MTIDALPPAPQPTDDTSTFKSKAFTWVAALANFVSQVNAAISDMLGYVSSASTSATNAATSASAASAAALTASNANTTAGTSTTNYTPALGAANLVYVEAARTPQVGMRVRVPSSAAPATNFAAGIVTAWNAGTKTISINVDRIGPAPAAAAAWQIFSEGSPGIDGASASATTPVRVVAANGNITAADNGYMVKVTAAGVTLACDAPAVLSGSSVYFTASQHGVLLTGTFANLDGTNTAQTRAVPRGYAAILQSDGTGLRLDLIAPAALYQHVQNAAFTTALVDQACDITKTGAASYTVTVAANADVPYPIGTCLVFTNESGAGTLTVAAGGADLLVQHGTGANGNRVLNPWTTGMLRKIAPTWWLATGGWI